MTIEYRELRDDEAAAASAVVLAAFEAHIAPGFSAEGVAEFRGFASADAIAARGQDDTPHHQIVAVRDGTILGVGEVRGWQHLSMLFVHPDELRQGIGKELFRRLLTATRAHSPTTEQLTVNSSPYAVPVYERLGFAVAGPPKTISGIEHIPMTLAISSR